MGKNKTLGFLMAHALLFPTTLSDNFRGLNLARPFILITRPLHVLRNGLPAVPQEETIRDRPDPRSPLLRGMAPFDRQTAGHQSGAASNSATVERHRPLRDPVLVFPAIASLKPRKVWCLTWEPILKNWHRKLWMPTTPSDCFSTGPKNLPATCRESETQPARKNRLFYDSTSRMASRRLSPEKKNPQSIEKDAPAGLGLPLCLGKVGAKITRGRCCGKGVLNPHPFLPDKVVVPL